MKLAVVVLVSLCAIALVASPAQASPKCAICEFVATEIENFIENQHTEEEITHLLDDVCSLLPGSYGALCTSIVNGYGPALIEKLLARETPDVVCAQLSLCPASAQEEEEVKPAKKSLGGGDLECSLCTLIVGEVEKIIGTNKTEENVEAALDKVCDVLPSALSGPCETLVNRYLPALISLISQDFPADVVCKKIGLCKTSAAAPSGKPSPLGGFDCAACEYIAAAAEKFLGNNHTETEVVTFVEKVCSFLPGALKGECDVIIETYGPVIIDYLINKEDPKTLCTQLGICKRMSQEGGAQPGPLGGLECAACEYLMSLVESVLGNNATEAEIVQFVDKVCTLVPGSLKPACESLIETYGPKLIQFLLDREDPATFCAQVGLCKKSVSSAPRSSILCSVCNVAISYLENYITANSTEAEITSLVEGMCNKLPSVLAGACDAFVEQYGAYLINWLVNKEPPSKFCSTIGLCSSSVATGGRPSYRHVERTLNTHL